VWTAGLVAAQIALAWAVVGRSWMVWLPCAYVAGATIDHALWVLVHECSHNLVFRWRLANRVTALVANVPLVFPAAMSFCKYHLLHHRHMGEPALDADLPGATESRLVGRSAVTKTIWFSLLGLIQGTVRPLRLAGVRLVDGWALVNVASQTVGLAALVWWLGPAALKYLTASAVIAIGLHPFGARWIQEHYVVQDGQETYSYYGPLNRLAFNVGYHNEHHDVITVPWSKLPDVRRIAPEFYDGLHAHYSWTKLLVRFIRDRRLSLFRRMVRG
jgi:sphingolipid delta-4 desaturase